MKEALESVDAKQRSEIERWAAKQGYLLGDPYFWERLAQHWAYALAVRILFYFTIRPHFPGLPALQEVGLSSIRRRLQEAFTKARAIDWQAVFEESPLDKVGLPEAVEEPLKELLEDLNRRDFSHLREDVIGQIMEGLIPRVERHALGQYFTREDVVDFIIGFVVKDLHEGAYLDPTCGSGVFLTRLYHYLRFRSGYGLSHEALLQRIWGIDIAHFPAQLATINLFRQSPASFTEPPRIQVRDFFDLQPGDRVSLKLPKPEELPDLSESEASANSIEVPLPQFRGIVGNFPYIRQELIERKEKGYKKRLVQAIAKNWLWKDPELFLFRFGRKSTRQLREELHRTAKLPAEERHRLIEQWIEEGKLDLKLSGQADIYAYLFYHAAAFLKEGGRMGILTSNAWLDVAYGEHLKWFFLRHFKIIAVVGSWVEPWFEEAQVNTVFTILERCSAEEERRQHLVRFVKLKKKLNEILPQDLQIEEPERFRKIMALVRQIEGAEYEYYRRHPKHPAHVPIQKIISVENEAMRIRLVPQSHLERELHEKGAVARWSPYLRAPQVYFDLLEALGDKLVPLGKVGTVRFGIKTGINDFFYLEPVGEGSEPHLVRVRNGAGWEGEIEKACLRPAIKSPKDFRKLQLSAQEARYLLFLPPIQKEGDEDESTLRMRLVQKYPLAHEYVQWGSRKHNPKGIPWPQVSTVKNRKAWWLLEDKKPGEILLPMIIRERLSILSNDAKSPLYVDHNLFEFLPKEEYSPQLLSLLLNSAIVALIIEILGRVNIQGPIKVEGVDWTNIVQIPDPRTFLSIEDKIVSLYLTLADLPRLKVKEELKRKERIRIDEEILMALGLDNPKEWQHGIYSALMELVSERVSLNKLRSSYKAKGRAVSRSRILEWLKEGVLRESPRTVKHFWQKSSSSVLSIKLCELPVRYEQILPNQFDLLNQEGRQVGRVDGTEFQARYAIYAAKLSDSLVHVPSEPYAQNAVKAYEAYIRELWGQLLEKAILAVGDYKEAKQLAEEVLQQSGVPLLAIERVKELYYGAVRNA